MPGKWCHYDCSEHPETLTPNPDITGIGVSLAITISAGLAVTVVLVHYLVAYRYDTNPFPDLKPSFIVRNDDVFCPNPVDTSFLRSLRKRKCKTVTTQPACRQRALTKATLVMADVQLFNGLSIMISGYSQLRCGLSAYHWEKIVYLAWFSAITNLSCLTFLRNFLHHRKTGRLWRSIGLSILVIMIIVGLVPTGHYLFSGCVYDSRLSSKDFRVLSIRPAARDYAICYFNNHDFDPPIENSDAYKSCRDDLQPRLRTTQQYMVISALLLGFGLVQRLLRLHRAPNVILSRSQQLLTRKCIRSLRDIYSHCTEVTLRAICIRLFIYRPFLALFLTFRFLIEYWSSMAFEVWWLFVSFIWGAVKLWYLSSKFVEETEVSNWTFGQVMPLVLLGAPILTILEGFSVVSREEPKDPFTHSDTDSTFTVNLAQLASITNTADVAGDHPDRHYYTTPWMGPFISCFFLTIIFLSILVIFAPTFKVEPLSWFSAHTLFSGLLPLGIFCSIYFCIIFCISFPQPRFGRRLWSFCRVVFCICTFTWFVGVPGFLYFWSSMNWFTVSPLASAAFPLGVYVTVYFGLSLFVIVFRRRLWLTKMLSA